MFIAFPFRLGFFNLGCGAVPEFDFGIVIAFGRHVSGTLHRVNLTAAWNWLPDRSYESVLRRAGDVDSSDWTGRSMRLSGIGEWRHHFSLIRLKGAGYVGP